MLNDNVQVVDQLAASHQISSDGLTYTFTLKPNLKFSDGTPLTSKDIAYSINRTLLPATKSQVAYYLNLIKGYDQITAGKISTLIGTSLLTPDDNTLKIIISKPAAYFLNALTYPTSYPVEKKLIDKYGANWTDHLNEGGGDGPYKVVTYSHNTGMTLVPNPNYYGKAPKIQKLEFLQSGDSATTRKAYLNGQFDFSLTIPPADIISDRTRKDFVSAPLLVIRYLTMNYLAKPFDNIHIRQAFALALNKDTIATDVLKGAVKPTNHLVPQGMPGYNPNLQGIAGTGTQGDEAKAKQLLQQGLQEEHLTTLPSVTLTYYTDNTSVVQASLAMVQMWQTRLGVTVKTQPVLFTKEIDLSNATANNPKGLQMWFFGWIADYPDPQDWLSTFFAKGGADNLNNYGQNNNSYATEQQAVQQELFQADVDQTPTDRLQKYYDAEQKIVNDVGWIPVYQSALNYLQSSKLSPGFKASYSDSLNTLYPDDWANIYITQ
jgi:ABC-type oligopeptide transport system substrate-binding subunit